MNTKQKLKIFLEKGISQGELSYFAVTLGDGCDGETTIHCTKGSETPDYQKAVEVAEIAKMTIQALFPLFDIEIEAITKNY
jgi:hypothetical protein